MTDIFFIVDKTNALLFATGWDIITISMLHNAMNMVITVRVQLNNMVIGEKEISDNILSCDLVEQNKIIVQLHEFAIFSYDTYRKGEI